MHSSGRPATELRHAAARAGVRKRFAPHQLRHAHAVEMAREGVPLIVIQCQLGHTNLGITSIYLQGIDSTEIIDTVHARRPPMVPVDAQRSASDGEAPGYRSSSKATAVRLSRVASPNCCKSPGLSRARRRFPQVLQDDEGGLRRETHGTAVGGDTS